MSKLIGYATADWHAPERKNGGAWSSMPDVSGDVLFALAQTVDLCVKNNVPLFAAGDITDGPDPDPDALHALYSILRRGRRVYYVLGNHERGRDWLQPLGDLAVRLDDQIVELSPSIRVTGVSYIHKEDEYDCQLLKTVPTEIGLYHQSYREFFRGGGRSVNTLPKHKLAICGDTHIRKVVPTADGPALALSPGPLAPQSAAEVQPHEIFAVFDDLSVSPVQLKGRTYLTYEVNSESDSDQVIQVLHQLKLKKDLPKELQKPLVMVKMMSSLPDFVQLATRVAEDRDVILRFYGQPRKETPSAGVGRAARTNSGLDEVIAGWDAPEDEKALACRLVAPDANIREILMEERIINAAIIG